MKEPPVPVAVQPQVARALAVLAASLESLAWGMGVVAERHADNFGIRGTATVLAGWAAEDLTALEPFRDRLGPPEGTVPDRLRNALFGSSPEGLEGQLADLGDLSLLTHRTHMAWTIVGQGAKELHQAKLGEVAGIGVNHAERAIRWVRTQIKHTAPEALAVGAPSAPPESRAVPTTRPTAAVQRVRGASGAA
jgi:hypothetical protein